MLYHRPASEILVTNPPCLWGWLGDTGLLAPGQVMHTMEALGRFPVQPSGNYSMSCATKPNITQMHVFIPGHL